MEWSGSLGKGLNFIFYTIDRTRKCILRRTYKSKTKRLKKKKRKLFISGLTKHFLDLLPGFLYYSTTEGTVGVGKI